MDRSVAVSRPSCQLETLVRSDRPEVNVSALDLGRFSQSERTPPVPVHSHKSCTDVVEEPCALCLVAERPTVRQGAHLLGSAPGAGSSWEDALFDRLREAVEVTPLQRGLQRWTPKLAGTAKIQP